MLLEQKGCLSFYFPNQQQTLLYQVDLRQIVDEIGVLCHSLVRNFKTFKMDNRNLAKAISSRLTRDSTMNQEYYQNTEYRLEPSQGICRTGYDSQAQAQSSLCPLTALFTVNFVCVWAQWVPVQLLNRLIRDGMPIMQGLSNSCACYMVTIGCCTCAYVFKCTSFSKIKLQGQFVTKQYEYLVFYLIEFQIICFHNDIMY